MSPSLSTLRKSSPGCVRSLRRAAGHATSEFRCGPVHLDARAGRVSVDGNPVKLTSHEYRLLSYLMHHAGRVVSRGEIVEHLYDQDFDRDSNTIEVFVGRLRKKLGVDVIQTVRGLGYILAEPDDRRIKRRQKARPRSVNRDVLRKRWTQAGGMRSGRADVWPAAADAKRRKGKRQPSAARQESVPARPRPRSIAKRLFFSAALLSFAILLVAGLVLSTIYRRTAEANFDERLGVYLHALVADIATPGEEGPHHAGSARRAAIRTALVGLVLADHALG